MKKKLSDFLKSSLEQERKAVKEKNFNNIENRIDKAEMIFHDKEKVFFKNKNIMKDKKEEVKVIRDTFSLPEEDYELIEKCRQKSLEFKYIINKSEVIRAGLILLNSLPEDEFISALKKVIRIKTGRPKY